MFKQVTEFFLVALITCFYWLWSRAWFVRRMRLYNARETPTPFVYAHWHGDELLLIGAHVFEKLGVMVSRSRDGERLKKILSLLGFRVARGSSTRGAVGGLKGLIDTVNAGGCNASLAVDGPRGPIYKVKPGILKLAQQTQRPLVPVAAAANRRIMFQKAWNRCYLPFPFSQCVILYGEPLYVPLDATEKQFELLRCKLEQSLLLLKEKAEGYFARSFVGVGATQTGCSAGG